MHSLIKFDNLKSQKKIFLCVSWSTPHINRLKYDAQYCEASEIHLRKQSPRNNSFHLNIFQCKKYFEASEIHLLKQYPLNDLSYLNTSMYDAQHCEASEIHLLIESPHNDFTSIPLSVKQSTWRPQVKSS